MLRKIACLFAGLLIAGCASTERITDFSERSVGYGWLDIHEVQANRLFDVSIYQLRPRTEKPYYRAAVEEFKGGYLYWTTALPDGSHKTVTAAGQRCLGVLCTNTIYRYSFGKQGDAVAAVVITSPGVYYLGSYALQDVPTGFFEAGKFAAVTAKGAPTRREMLGEILRHEQGKPVIAERIRHELATLP